MTPVKVNMLFSMMNVFDSNTLPNFVEREKRIVGCVENYIESQSKTYAKIVKNNLYDLIHNFDIIASKIYGKKPVLDDATYEEKIRALARVQCEAYNDIGVLK
jgi:hypothetical protein